MTDRCVRCGLVIERDGQMCAEADQPWPCRTTTDQSLFDAPVGGKILHVKAGWNVNPIKILEDPYEQ